MASIKIGAAWMRTSANGKDYLSGTLELPGKDIMRIVIFKNFRKEEGDRKPDYEIFLSTPRDESVQEAQKIELANDINEPLPVIQLHEQEEINVADIPF